MSVSLIMLLIDPVNLSQLSSFFFHKHKEQNEKQKMKKQCAKVENTMGTEIIKTILKI